MKLINNTYYYSVPFIILIHKTWEKSKIQDKDSILNYTIRKKKKADELKTHWLPIMRVRFGHYMELT